MSSLTLRKPSPLAVEAFVNRDEESASAVLLAPPPTASPIAAPAVQLAPAAAVEVFETPARHPKSNAKRSAPEVERAAKHFEPDAITFRRASRAMVRRRTKPDRRRVTVYLDLDVASELAAYVSKADKEMSSVVSDALRTWLSKQRP